ncbi:MAG: LPS assembly lipoprotein LptE [Rhodopila sp.]|jgi:LPS-assembly lipoprotein
MLGRRWLCLGAVAALGGCGFQPVYMPTASGKTGAAQRELQTVFVGIIPERPGQILRQALQERLGSDAGAPSQYELRVVYGIPAEGIAIQPNDIATRLRLTGRATWTLFARDAKHTALITGSARAIDGINIFDAQYFAADLEVETVQKRLAQNLADQITTQLAIWFRRQAEQQRG